MLFYFCCSLFSQTHLQFKYTILVKSSLFAKVETQNMMEGKEYFTKTNGYGSTAHSIDNVSVSECESEHTLFHFDNIKTDPQQDHKATEIKVLSFARPHMRAFHGSWMCFAVSFFMWFSIAPLLPVVQKSLNLTNSDIWLSNICSVSGTVIVRFLMGPLCDKYGAKSSMTKLIAICLIPCYLLGTSNNLLSLCVFRTILSFAGGTMVAGQYWASCMFTKSVVGTAMAFSGGWGSVGFGIANILMGSVIYPFCTYLTNGDEDLAWRISFIFPATLALLTALFFSQCSDDCPLGNYKDVRKTGLMEEKSAVESFRSGSLNRNTWILFLQYSASFGVELTMENGCATYLHDQFGLSVEQAGRYASLFGFTNIFSRGLGGYLSDKMNAAFSLRGRLIVQFSCLVIMGVLIQVFGHCQTLFTTIFTMIFFSTFTQMSMGACYGIVPYIDPANTGSIAGIVGAGGNIGAIVIGNVFRLHTYEYSFMIMGVYTMIMALLTPFLRIKGSNSGMLFGKETQEKTPLM